jgi:hypothetical protein
MMKIISLNAVSFCYDENEMMKNISVCAVF